MTTEVMDSPAVKRALRHFEAHRSPLCRSNSRAYAEAVEKIRAATQPMKAADEALDYLTRRQARGASEAIRGLAKGCRGGNLKGADGLPDELVAPRQVTTADLDALRDHTASRLGGRLDPTHHRLFERMEGAIHERRLTRDEFVRLGLAAQEMAVFNPRTGVWQRS